MGCLETYLIKKLKGISKPQKALFLSVFISGFFAHGYMFLNNLTYNDGILSINSLGATFNLGRFVLGFIEIAGKYTVGVYAAPLFHGILSLFFIALSGMIILDILRIKGVLSGIYTGIVMAVFPVVASIFAYMYTASAYWSALLLNVLAVRVMVKKQRIKNVVIGAVLLAMGLGIYQAYFTVAITLFFLAIMKELLEDMKIMVKDIIVRGIWYLSTMSLGLIVYLILNKVIITIGKIGLSSYMGMNEVGKTQLSKIPSMLKNVFYYFGVDLNWCGINNTLIQRLIVAGIIFLSVALIILALIKGEGTVGNKIILTVMTLALPVAVNSIYLMSASDNFGVHTLMRYSLVFIFIMPIILLEHIERLEIHKKRARLCKNGICYCLLMLIWLLPVTYIYLDNASYMKMDFLTKQTSAWFTELVSEIKSTEGYSDELPVVYIGERAVEDIGLAKMPHFEAVTADGFGYSLEKLVNNYAWRAYVERHCGYSPEEIWEREEYEEMEEVKQMPAYPTEGSIKVINNTIVVKFS